MRYVASMRLIFLFCTGVLASATGMKHHRQRYDEQRNNDISGADKWSADPKLVVFGNSLSDRGRRFEAPASFKFEGIGVFPWEAIFKANDTEELVEAYARGLGTGSVTNGKTWTEWLGVGEGLNFATSSASISDSFRSLERCLGYTGDGEEFPTGTLNEQIDRYLHEVVTKTPSTLGHAHVILLGGNDVFNLWEAHSRYIIGQTLEESGALGGETYDDPVPYEKVFEIVDSIPQLTSAPLITDVVTALSDGVAKLLAIGVTGRIFIGSLPSSRGFADFVESGLTDIMEPILIAINNEILAMVKGYEQLRSIDLHTLTGSFVDDPDTWTELGFVAPEDEESGESLPLGTPCFETDFVVDSTADVMGTQVLRSADCQEECALCADDTSPCQTCYVGNPSATICDSPDTRLLWDSVHPTTAAHYFISQAILQCVGKEPNYDVPLVDMLCPGVVED